VRGRFLSKIVDHGAYWAHLVRYLDDNPVAAGIVVDPTTYPYGSAFHYVRSEGPHWLDRGPVERYVAAQMGTDRYDPASYRKLFHRALTPSEREWVETRIERGDRHGDHFADLMRATPSAVREWLCERARNADGMTPGVPIVDAATLLTALAAAQEALPVWKVGRTRPCDGWSVMTAGLLTCPPKTGPAGMRVFRPHCGPEEALDGEEAEQSGADRREAA
jgi:hypothetical protein